MPTPFNNYEIMRDQMAGAFLRYDQETMIEKFSLKYIWTCSAAILSIISSSFWFAVLKSLQIGGVSHAHPDRRR